MLSERDGHELRTSDVSAALCGLDDEHAVMWLALADDEPVASTAAYLRMLHVAGDQEPMPIGYWAHLFVLPEHRKLMVYPQLVFTMRRAMAELGIHAILTAMRRPNVTEGHLKLGFKSICTWPVLIKPLRPFALLAKHRGVRLAGLFAPIGDAVWSLAQSLLGPRSSQRYAVHSATDVRSDQALLDQLAELLSDAASDRYSTLWDVETLSSRLGGGVDGQPYTIIIDRDETGLRGAAICRMAVRGNDIHTGVVLELVDRENDTARLRGLAQRCEAHLREQGAEALLWLDGAGEPTSTALRGLGYRVAPGETYRLIAYTDDHANALLSSQASDWRFTFLDHDAF